MPKIFGTSLLGILAATVVFYILGALWYGFLFNEAWMASAGLTEESAKVIADKLGVMMWIGGILITFMQVIGLSYILNHSGASLMGTCIKVCAVIAILIALPMMAYNSLYQGYPMNGLLIDLGHIFVGYCLVGAILSFFRGKDAIGD